MNVNNVEDRVWCKSMQAYGVAPRNHSDGTGIRKIHVCPLVRLTTWIFVYSLQ